jgi:ActR/RegA family two-component response regulator
MISIRNIILSFSLLLLISCEQSETQVILVTTNAELHTAIKNVKAGTSIVLKNGVWKDVNSSFAGVIPL